MAWEFSVLVVANVTASSDELLDALRERSAAGACRFTLVMPGTGADRHEHLEAALERMREAGLENVEGSVGDPDPIVAVDGPGPAAPAREAHLRTGPARGLAATSSGGAHGAGARTATLRRPHGLRGCAQAQPAASCRGGCRGGEIPSKVERLPATSYLR